MSDAIIKPGTRLNTDSVTKPRLWPGLLILGLLGAARLWAISGDGSPTQFFVGLFLAPMAVLLLLILWWMFFSRVSRLDKVAVIGTLVAAFGATALVSLDSFGIFGLVLYAVPFVEVVWVGLLLISVFLAWPIRRAVLLAGIVVSVGIFSLLRFNGTDGAFNADISWRWTPTAEANTMAKLKALDAEKKIEPVPTAVAKIELQPGDWPGFRGPDRDSVVHGSRIASDWTKTPPKLVWKRPVGPGWSSFAVVGDHLYTQEQRDGDEVVICYRASTGDEIWRHVDKQRFDEKIGGPGPRGTPTFHDGKIYAQGANGTVNCLDAATGKVIWSRDVVKDADAKVPMWGYASSPLVVKGVVTVFAGGEPDKAVIAYNADTGEPVWSGGKGKLSYASTQAATVAGVEQLLFATEAGVTAFEPEKGTILWSHDWPSGGVVRIVQPVVLGDSDVVIGTGMGIGTRRIHVSKDGSNLTTKEVWTSTKFKPYYNDFVVYKDHAYGFDTNMFVCIRLEDGKSMWRERGYGSGQVLLLADQGLLLILSETGEVALVEANPEHRTELGRFEAIEKKTWNHPVLVRDRLYVRNGQEMACYELPTLP
jgi:outer membrane protein assembly factor BamB